jgi:hypothetical protein
MSIQIEPCNEQVSANESPEVDAYEVAEKIVVRHGLRRIPGKLLAKYVWTAADITKATGLNAAEVEELQKTGCIRAVVGGGVTIRDDILDLLGVRWALQGDTKASYVERCDFVGVRPDVNSLRRLPDGARQRAH